MKVLRKARYLLTLIALPLALLLPGTASADLQGFTSFNGGITSTPSPVLTGTIPSYCGDVGIAIIDGEGQWLANNSRGTNIDLFSDTGQVVLNNGNWSVNLAANGIGLIPGYYTIFVDSPCGSGDYGNPLYDDIYTDNLLVLPQGCDTDCVPLQRFYNVQNGSHFYTTNIGEASGIVANDQGTFNYEGVDSFVHANQEPGTLPVYRFYNFINGTHFYTSNQAEATEVNNTEYNTYRYEGVAFYAYASPAPCSVPVYRFYDFQNGTHFYTSNQAEASQVNNTEYNTYTYEGIAYYAIAN